jgi:hypothetical protein
MNPRLIAALKIVVVTAAVVGLVLLFPKGLEFVELAGRELRYLWWIIFLVILAIWLIWGLGSKKK